MVSLISLEFFNIEPHIKRLGIELSSRAFRHVCGPRFNPQHERQTDRH